MYEAKQIFLWYKPGDKIDVSKYPKSDVAKWVKDGLVKEIKEQIAKTEVKSKPSSKK